MSDRYERSTYISYYWQGSVTENESVFPLESRDGQLQDIPLMYPAEEILEVRSSDLSTLYTEGKDYVLQDGRLRILPGGSIPTVPYGSYFFEKKPEDVGSFPCRLGGHIFFAEKDGMHCRQIALSYRHSAPWSGPIPAAKGNLLPKTLAKLTGGEALKVLVYGDSICTGANSTMCVEAAPYAETWFDMLVGTLRDSYSAPIELVNTAVGGTATAWGLENARELAADHRPDLAIIGFGMNDGSGRIPAEKYIQRIAGIMDCIRQQNPEVEFILISTMMPHAIVHRFLGNQEEYLPELMKLEGEGCAVANVTEMHKYLLSRKRYYDMSGNNVNHPNDFLARLYAQVLRRTMEK